MRKFAARCRGRQRSPRSPAAKASLDKIQRKLQNVGVAQNVYYGLSLGSVLLLAAIGLASLSASWVS